MTSRSGRRHDLPMPSVLDRQAMVTLDEIEDVLAEVPGVADPAFVRTLAGQARFAARSAIVAELERLELLEKIEPHTNQVPHGDRGGVPVEPLLTTQWYCNAGVLAKPAIEAVESGRTVFVPKQWENTFFAWMRDIQPWCISRQLWWGHRIPAWYGPDETVFVAKDAEGAAAQARAHYGRDEVLVQDEDVLDTWFSSGLWPFSTLGWPEHTPELDRYYPGDVLVTGFDIIFFWVARMMMLGLHMMDDVPFRTVYIHGLVRDEKGRKMSKTTGNVIDPLELIDSYGADALRFTICALTGPGRDVKLSAARVENYRGFVTKLWNAARFCEMNGIRPGAAFEPTSVRLPLSRWLLDSANTAVAEATTALEAYRFDDYAAAGYRFVWNTFCDWFVEFSKPLLAEGADAGDARGNTGCGCACAWLDFATAASGHAVRDGGAVGSFRLRRALLSYWREVAGTCCGSGCGGCARGTGLGGSADHPGAIGAGGDECAAVQTLAGAAAGCAGRDAGTGGSVDRGDQTSGAGLGGAAAERRRAEGVGSGGAG